MEEILELLPVFSLVDVSALMMWMPQRVVWEGDMREGRAPLVEGVTVVSSTCWLMLMLGCSVVVSENTTGLQVPPHATPIVVAFCENNQHFE